METQKLSGSLEENKAAVKELFNDSIDLIERSFRLGGKRAAAIFYMSGVTDVDMVQEYVIKPLINMRADDSIMLPEKKPRQESAGAARENAKLLQRGLFFLSKEKGKAENKPQGEDSAENPQSARKTKKNAEVHAGITDFILENVLEAAEIKQAAEFGEISTALLYGDCVILIDGEETAIVAAAKKWEKRGISEPPTSAVIRGPREGFTEDMKGNTVQIRRRLRTPDLIFEIIPIGRYSHTNVAVSYIKGVADENIIKKVKERLKKISIDGIIDSFYIQQFLEERKNSIFKMINYCEKPDIAAARMLEGRVALIVDGSPIVLTLPYMFLEDLQSSQDYYNMSPLASIGMVVRFLALFISILLPGFYVAMQIYHYNVLPIKMIITLTNAIQGTPFAPLTEMLIVTFLFVIIHEASLRMPKYVGMAMSIVGALVLGDTAVKAGIISSPSVLIAAISTLAAHLVPDQVSATGFIKILLIVAAGLMGVLGLIAGTITLLTYMSSLDSYGTPFMAPFSPLIVSDLKDGITKLNVAERKTRPFSIPGPNKTRVGEMEDTGDDA